MPDCVKCVCEDLERDTSGDFKVCGGAADALGSRITWVIYIVTLQSIIRAIDDRSIPMPVVYAIRVENQCINGRPDRTVKPESNIVAVALRSPLSHKHVPKGSESPRSRSQPTVDSR